MDKNAKLVTHGNASVFYGSDIIVFENATLEIGSSFINSDCKIRCHKNITIGDGCAISHDFTIMVRMHIIWRGIIIRIRFISEIMYGLEAG